ncbi:MAG: TolC family protein, partial [Bacteroidota bacterium]
VEFPSVYSARNQLIRTQSGQIEFDFAERRQEILAEAKKYCLELIYLEKRLVIEQERIAQAQEVLEQAQERYEKEQIGIIELNKAKVAWMQDRYRVEHIQKDKVNALNALKTLNGGGEIRPGSSEYVHALELPEVETLWNEKLTNDPTLGLLRQQESIAMHQLKLSKSKTLPNLTAGFNSQGIAGERFSGIYAGLSIPLWSNRNQVKSAQSNLKYQEAFAETKTQMAFTEFENEYNDYQHKLERFQNYQETLNGLNSESLLLEAYQLGEISFLEYYQELQFFREAVDTMLDMQHQLYQAKNKLLRHQL